MLNALKGWQGEININGVCYNSIEDAIKTYKGYEGEIHIILKGIKKKPLEGHISQNRGNVATIIQEGTYRLKVKQYMTKKATPEFDFMAKWNNDNPMPLRVMVGEKVKETPGMVYMKLHGDILDKVTQCCMKCGKAITNPVSRYFGMGPECGGHGYVNPFNSDEELKLAVEEYRKKLNKVTWEGWIIKSSIESIEQF